MEADDGIRPVLEDGRPRVRRVDGRPRVGSDSEFASRYVTSAGLALEATDLAGNVSRVAIDPLEEALVPLGAEARCRC